MDPDWDEVIATSVISLSKFVQHIVWSAIRRRSRDAPQIAMIKIQNPKANTEGLVGRATGASSTRCPCAPYSGGLNGLRYMSRVVLGW